MWSNAEKAAGMARKALGWEDADYRNYLLNIAGIRPCDGKVSSTNLNATHDGFVRFMAFCEKQGYEDPKRGPGYWSKEATKFCPRMHFRIRDLAAQGQAAGILAADGLAGFIERQTQQRTIDAGGPTRILEECDWEWSYKVLEGLKAWLRREAKKRGLKLDGLP